MSFSVNYPVAKQVMREINFTRRVSVRYNAEACVTRIMRETWQVCLIYNRSYDMVGMHYRSIL